MHLPQGRVEPRPVRLTVLVDLFQSVHAENVSYCHWKSNDHLAASMAGATDLDLLVQRRASSQLTRILSEHGFKRFLETPGRSSPGIETVIGFDAATGQLVYLDIHYQLTLGEKFLKGYRLPWEELMLSTRQLDDEHGIYVADPHLELLMMVIRSFLKLRTRDVLLNALGRPYTARSALHEIPWLAGRIQRERLSSLATRLVGPAAARTLAEMLGTPRPTLAQLLAFGRRVRPRLREYRTYGPVAARLRRWIGEWRAIWGTLDKRIRHGVGRAKRTAQGGLIVALAGADGAGKSVVTRALAKWLSRDFALLAIRGGSASGERDRVVRARRARNRGLIVICDRWPLPQPSAANDELAALHAGDLNPPDLVLKLHVSPATALQRKPGTPIERLGEQAETVRRLRYPTATCVVDIDAEQSLEEVLLQVKRAVWTAI
jgi:hypothetical protein